MSGGALVLLVEMRIRPGKRAAFMPLVLENGKRSLEDEPGCTRFDVLAPADGADRVVLYEIYADDAAFDAHRRTEHYARFKEASRDLLEATSVQRFRMAE
jgi:quinol monooxygenase YgiN